MRAVTDAFVRASGGGLLLPRLVAIGDADLGEAAGAALDAIDDGRAPARGVAHRAADDPGAAGRRGAGEGGRPASAAEAVRLAGDLARTLDQLLVEEVSPARLRDLDLAPS